MGSPKINYEQMNNQEILELFKKNYYSLQPKNAIEFFTKCNIPSQYILKTRLGLTYSQALINLGVRKTLRVKRGKRVSKDYYYKKYGDKLKDIYFDLGYIPNSVEISKYGIRQCNIYNALGITYSEFVEKVGFAKEDIKDYKIKRNKTNNVNRTNEELLQMYVELCYKLKKIATATDINESEKIPSAGVYMRRFGSINEVKRLSCIDRMAVDRRWFSKEYILKNLKEMYIENGKRLKIEEFQKQLINYFERGICLNTIFIYFNTTSMKQLWEIVEKELLKDYIKEKKKGKGEKE